MTPISASQSDDPQARSETFVAPRLPTHILLAFLCVAMAGIGVALFSTLSAEQDARREAAQTFDVLDRLRSALRLGLEAETGQRGFLLTLERDYLAPYERGATEWLPAIDAVEAAFGPDVDATQREAIETMRTIARAKLDELSRTITLTREGRRNEALAIVATDVGNALMLRFRDEAEALERSKRATLTAALDRAETIRSRMVPILAVLALATLGLVILGIRLQRRANMAEARAREADEQRRARERSDLMARELNHRVKNLFAVILAIVSLSGRGGGDGAAIVAKLRARIHALSRAHALGIHAVGDDPTRSGGSELHALLATTLDPYMDGDEKAKRIAMTGPPVALPAPTITPIALLIHELATNAVKYGALSVPDGHITIDWTLEAAADGASADHEARRTLRLQWSERDGPATAEPTTTGFGSLMLRQAAAQLDGQIERHFGPDGLDVTMVLTLSDAPGADRPND